MVAKPEPKQQAPAEPERQPATPEELAQAIFRRADRQMAEKLGRRKENPNG